MKVLPYRPRKHKVKRCRFCKRHAGARVCVRCYKRLYRLPSPNGTGGLL